MKSRIHLLQLLDGTHHLAGHIDIRGALLLGDRERDNILAVVASDGACVLLDPGYNGDIRKMDHVPVLQRDRDILQALHAGIVVGHANVQFLIAHMDAPGRNRKIRRAHQLGYLIHRKVILLQLLFDQLHSGIVALAAGQRNLAYGA